ncbi:cytochrome P450 [Streptomyces sp. NPDC018000]|uniref:cytochrome P450 n=1 Tax=Streptomyces sp. NPDC018000 TaxID=3365028 RepID=UPI00378D13BB
MVRTAPRQGRRIQLRQGLVWLAAARGDPYGALLRGLDTDPRPYWRAIAEQPLSRSFTGDWVTARHHVALAVRSEPALRARPLLDGVVGPVPASTEEDDAAWPAEEGWERALTGRTPGDLDVVAATRKAATGTLARRWGLDAAEERALSTASALTGGALDAPFYPQNLADTRRIANGEAALRALPSVGASDERLLLATAGVAMAAGLVVDTLVQHTAATAGQDLHGLWSRLRAEPRYATPMVAETLRLASPAQLYAAVADSPCDIAGRRIKAGDHVVVVIGGANRDPEVFTEPDRFDPDRAAAETAAVLPPGLTRNSVLSFAVANAREGLRQLALLCPGRAPAGAVVRRPAAPVSRPVVTYPVATS